MSPARTRAWQQLAELATAALKQSLQSLSDAPVLTPLSVANCHFDFSKQRVDDRIVDSLIRLCEELDLDGQRTAMLQGGVVNLSERRAALHTALRGGAGNIDPSITADVAQVRQRMINLATAIRSGDWRGFTNKPISDVVHIGIGGSHLGPELVVTALNQFAAHSPRVHFAANVDAHELDTVLRPLNPETTLFIIASKTFTTLETRINAESARSWFLERTCSQSAIARHFVAVTTNTEAAAEFGLPVENLFPLWDWVGGRYSLWSAIGIPIMIALGPDAFDALLRGARTMDKHFANTEPRQNIPLISALLATWNYNFLGATSLAVLCYDERLALLPDYLQQLEMESNGKSVTQSGEPVSTHTMPILWGGTGTRGQHAYHQLLHQGTRAFSADFIVVRSCDHEFPEHHDWLKANALAQSQAMALGFEPPEDEPHRAVPGNRPSTTIILEDLTPESLGALLAAYEHKVFCQGAIWNINSFDQWGVELGKALAQPIFKALSGQADRRQDAATQRLIDRLT
jgi:glucose-6-phosphate isomerase